MKKNKIKFTQFELLQETANGTMVSGFSVVLSSAFGGLVKETNTKCTINNCQGGNCVKDCGLS